MRDLGDGSKGDCRTEVMSDASSGVARRPVSIATPKVGSTSSVGVGSTGPESVSPCLLVGCIRSFAMTLPRYCCPISIESFAKCAEPDQFDHLGRVLINRFGRGCSRPRRTSRSANLSVAAGMHLGSLPEGGDCYGAKAWRMSTRNRAA
jgi:hypothetical protein